MYIYTHTYIHIYTYIYIYIHILANIYTNIHINTHLYTYTHIHTHIHIYTNIYMYTYTYIDTHVHIHIHTHIIKNEIHVFSKAMQPSTPHPFLLVLSIELRGSHTLGKRALPQQSPLLFYALIQRLHAPCQAELHRQLIHHCGWKETFCLLSQGGAWGLV